MNLCMNKVIRTQRWPGVFDTRDSTFSMCCSMCWRRFFADPVVYQQLSGFARGSQTGQSVAELSEALKGSSRGSAGTDQLVTSHMQNAERQIQRAIRRAKFYGLPPDP